MASIRGCSKCGDSTASTPYRHRARLMFCICRACYDSGSDLPDIDVYALLKLLRPNVTGDPGQPIIKGAVSSSRCGCLRFTDDVIRAVRDNDKMWASISAPWPNSYEERLQLGGSIRDILLADYRTMFAGAVFRADFVRD